MRGRPHSSKITIWFLWAALMAPAGGGWAAEPAPDYAAIQRVFLREAFSSVVALAPAYILQHPDTPEAFRIHIWWALSLDRLQRSNEALIELDHLKARLTDGDSLWAEVLFWEGDVSRRALQTIHAKLAFERLLERYPNSTWASQAQMGLGLIYLHQHAYEMAAGYFHEVALRYATLPVARDALLFEGFCQLRMRHFKDAVTLLSPLLDQLHEPFLVAQAAFYLGESLSGLGRDDDAARAYQRAVSSDASSSWGQFASFGLGWASYRLGRCEESVSAFERYLSQRRVVSSAASPVTDQANDVDRRTEALFAQGNCLLQLGNEPEALLRFGEVRMTNPRHRFAVESGFAMADIYRTSERVISARTLLESMLQDPLDVLSRAKVQLRLGTMALHDGQADQAQAAFESASHTEDAAIRQSALSGLGDVEMSLDHLTAAAQRYKQAAQASPGSVLASYAMYQLGRLRLQSGALNEAINIFQRVADGPDADLAGEAKLALALTYLGQREERLARSWLDAIHRQRARTPLAARAAYYLALLELSHEHEDVAESLCQEVLAGAPNAEEAIDARLLLADLLARRTSVRAAMVWLRDAYASSSLPRQRGKLAQRLGDFARNEDSDAEAIRWYEIAIDVLPSVRPEVTYRIASCYEDAGDLERAMQWYRVIDAAPWSVRGQLALAKLLERENRSAEAQAIYQRLAAEPIPEAKAIQERLVERRSQPTQQHNE